LSADGATLAVGARGEDGATTGINGDEMGNTAINSGAVYMFTRDGGGVWTQQAYVKASNTDGDDQFGASVTLADNGATLGVGASGEDSAASGINGDETNNTVTDSGAIYAFTQDDGGAWTQQAYIKASHLDADDFFGFSVVLSNDGTMLATGVRGEDSAATGVNGDESDNSATNSGAVYMFTRDSDDTWTELAYLKASNADVADFLGRSVALSDPGATLVVAVGAGGEDSIATGVNGDETDNNAESSGAAYVFER